MKPFKIFAGILGIALGVFLVVFGEGDDSPGAQGLGLIVAVFSAWRIVKVYRSAP